MFDAQGVEHLDPISQKGLYQALVADEAFSADTLGELAELMGLPVRTFKEQIAAYNRRSSWGQESGRQPQDKCSREGCTPLLQPPFWAYEVGLTIHYTPGGIVVDEFGRVKRGDRSIVPGLWAAGEVTGSVHGSNRLGGNGLADALTFGRLTGEAAARNAPKNF